MQGQQREEEKCGELRLALPQIVLWLQHAAGKGEGVWLGWEEREGEGERKEGTDCRA